MSKAAANTKMTTESNPRKTQKIIDKHGSDEKKRK